MLSTYVHVSVCDVDFCCSSLVQTNRASCCTLLLLQVVAIASMALRKEAEQLLSYCVYYLGTNLQTVYELHGRDCLPPLIHAKVKKLRRDVPLWPL